MRCSPARILRVLQLGESARKEVKGGVFVRLVQGEPLTVVVTDIMSSTLLWNLFPAAMNRAMELHDQCLREQLKLLRGYELFTEGDAFFVAFRHAHHALAFCLSVQRRLNELPWDLELCEYMSRMSDAATFRGHGLRVRMGMHSGVAESVMHNPVTNRVTYKARLPALPASRAPGSVYKPCHVGGGVCCTRLPSKRSTDDG